MSNSVKFHVNISKGKYTGVRLCCYSDISIHIDVVWIFEVFLNKFYPFIYNLTVKIEITGPCFSFSNNNEFHSIIMYIKFYTFNTHNAFYLKNVTLIKNLMI
jgi:hypothetical protein